MTEFLARRFISRWQEVKNPDVRQAYGKMASISGIAVNLLICIGELVVGYLAGSVAIISDGVHNVADAGGSVLSLISFKISGRKPDLDHPYGHGRVEYLFSIGFAVILFVVAIELFVHSVERIREPSHVEFSMLALIVMICVMASKVMLYFFQTNIGKRIDSTMLKANALESLSDVWATAAITTGLLVSPMLNFSLDGYLGALVSFMIGRAGFRVFKSSTSALVGNDPAPERVKEISDFVRSFDGVIGIHDLMIHNYGPGHEFASIHVEVDATVDIMKTHDLVDRIEREAKKALRLQLTIHMDPLIRDEQTKEIYRRVCKMVKAFNPGFGIHDLRAVRSDDKINVIFDLVVPYSESRSLPEVKESVEACVEALDDQYVPIINIGRSFVGDTDITAGNGGSPEQ